MRPPLLSGECPAEEVALLRLATSTTTEQRASRFLALRRSAGRGRKGAARSGGDASPSDDLAGYVLAPQAELDALLARLREATDAEVEAFVGRFEGERVADVLRREWSKELARRGRWTDVERHGARVESPDLELRCRLLDARRRRGDRDLGPDSRALWREVGRLHEGCRAYFTEAFARQILPEDEAWRRASARLVRGEPELAEGTLELLRLSKDDRAQLRRALSSRAGDLLEPLPKKGKRLGGATLEVVSTAVRRAALEDLEKAGRLLEKIAGRLPEERRSELWATLGARAARENAPHALEWLDRAGDVPRSDDAWRWAARAYLRAERWAALRVTIHHMPTALAEEPAWIYWLGRALEGEGASAEAAAQWMKISGELTFYGILAAERLGGGVVIVPRPPPATRVELLRAADRPATRRALELHRLGLRREAGQEWRWAKRGARDRDLLALAEVARCAGAYDLAIDAATSTSSVADDWARYPAPYADLVAAAARDEELDEAWILGLIRQESRFVGAAKSVAGAQGIMQIMPATARGVAKARRLESYAPDALTKVEVNIAIGTMYLGSVHRELGDRPVLATAAYNAGPPRVRRWRGSAPEVAWDAFVETIPFAETREYTMAVLANAAVYRTLASGKPDLLAARMASRPVELPR